MDNLTSYRGLREKTLPGLFVERVKNTPAAVAFRAKKLGIYEEVTWSALSRTVSDCAMALKAFGLESGQKAAFMGDPCPENLVYEIAAQSVGGITLAIHASCSKTELHDLLEGSDVSLLLVQDQECLDRILPLWEHLPQLARVFIIDQRGRLGQSHPRLVTYADLLAKGRALSESEGDAFVRCVQQVKSSDGAFIAYTSGTTGRPKPVLISHGNHLAAAQTLIERYPVLKESPHRTVVHLPLSLLFGRVVSVTLPLLSEIVPHYGETVEDLGATMFEVAPTVFFTMPGHLQKMASNLFVMMENSTRLKRAVYKRAWKVGRRRLERISRNRKGFWLDVVYWTCYQTAFRPILNKLGLKKAKLVLSTGASLPTEVMTFWHACGLNVSEFYGLTEIGGAVVCAQEPCFPRPGNVGRPTPGWEIGLSDTGEILVRCEVLFESGSQGPDLGSGCSDEEGWVHTGDAGEWDAEGNLKLLGPCRELIEAPGGVRIMPARVEGALRSSPFIREAVAFGRDGAGVCALLDIEYDAVSDWAGRNAISFTGFLNLIGHPDVMQLMAEEVEKANRVLGTDEQVRAFRILETELSPGDEEAPVTPTRKVKRHAVYKKHRDMVKSMNSEP